MRTQVPAKLLLVVAAVFIAACSGNDGTVTESGDAGGHADAGSDLDSEISAPDSSNDDTGTTADATLPSDASIDASDASGDAGVDAAEPPTCEGPCRELTAEVRLDVEPIVFSDAFYGVKPPADTASGQWEITTYLVEQAVEGCPDGFISGSHESFVLAIPFPDERTSADESDGLRVTLMGPDIVVPVAEADSESITNLVGVVCRDCPEGDPDGWVAFDLTSSLTNGHVYATHCPFLDGVN